MSRNRLLGIGIFIIGAILIAGGYQAEAGASMADRFANDYVNYGSWYMYGGFAGIILSFHCRWVAP